MGAVPVHVGWGWTHRTDLWPGGQEPGRVEEVFPRIPVTFGSLALSLVPAGTDTVPFPAAGKGRGNVSAQPLLHLLSGPETGEAGQSGLLLTLPAPTLPGAQVSALSWAQVVLQLSPVILLIFHTDPACWIIIAPFYQRSSERLSDSWRSHSNIAERGSVSAGLWKAPQIARMNS